MENKSPGANDAQLLWLVGIFLGWVAFSRFGDWFQLWVQSPKNRLYLVVFLCLALGVLWQFAYGRLKRIRESSVHEKSILGQGVNAVYCGISTDKKTVFIKPRQRIMHTQVVGTTNAGKTESVILPWAIQDMFQGRGFLLIDGKADRDLLEKLWSYAFKAGRADDFKLFSLGSVHQSRTFNPLIGGTAEEITERIFSAFTFENPFYRSLQYEVLAQTLRIFEAADEIPTFLKLHQAISRPSLLEGMCDRGRNAALHNWIMQFKNLPGVERDQRTSGLTSQISHFAFGKAAPLFNVTNPGISIDTALATGKIVYFQLPVLLSPFLGAATGKLVLQSLQSAIAKRHRGDTCEKPFFSVFLDDFSEYLYPGFVSVLNKSRSANIGVVFAHQALGDIQALGDAVTNAILTNSNLKIFMRGNDPDSAEHFAKVIGTKSTVKLTERRKMTVLQNERTGDVSSREVEEFIIHPNCFKRDLGVGEAVMIVPHERGSKTIRLKFDRFPDLPNAPMPTVTHGEAIGFNEVATQSGQNDKTVSEVLRIKQKEPSCIPTKETSTVSL